MSISHKHRFEPATESDAAVAASNALGRLLFKELMATEGDNVLIVRFYDLVEKPFLEEVFKHCKGNASKAAELTGLHRATLRKLCRRYGIPAGRAK